MDHSTLLTEKLWLYEKILESTEDLISVVDLRARYLYVSPSHTRVLGYKEEELLGKNGIRLFHRDDIPEIIKKMTACVVKRKPVSATARFRHKDGHYLVLEGIGVPLLNKFGIPDMILVTSRNITERKQLEDKIRHMALHDPLTGIPNRLLLEDRARHLLRTAKRHAKLVAVLFIDLDNFKEVNDTYGHGTGDFVLKEIATRLENSLRGEDTVARLGGDEFLVLLSDLPSAIEAEKTVKKVLRQIQKPIRTEQADITVSASCGIALYPEDGTTSEELFKKADAALYAAKHGGKSGYRFSKE